MQSQVSAPENPTSPLRLIKVDGVVSYLKSEKMRCISMQEIRQLHTRFYKNEQKLLGRSMVKISFKTMPIV